MGTVLQRAVARNDPCPCGSGKRFKDCHGSLRDETPATPRIVPPPGRKSRYRPAADDWAAQGEDERDRLGVLMETALRYQLEGRVRDAERAYRAVLEQAPRTHDALHMLGVVRLGLGDLSEAERLIRDAKALRPAYPAIEKNWTLVRQAIAARDRGGIEILSEHALPLLCATLAAAKPGTAAAAPTAEAPLHVVETVFDPANDAGWASQRIAQLLATLAPTTWRADDLAQSQCWQRLDSRVLDPATGRRPLAGDVILTTIECETDTWLREPRRRVLLFVHAATPALHLERLRKIAADGARPVALAFQSRAVAKRFGCIDYVVPPPIDLAEYAGAAKPMRSRDSRAIRVATVGQDGRRVVVAGDVQLLKDVARKAGELWLLDPGPLRYELGSLPAVRCIGRGECTIAEFLSGADVYLHRSHPWWAEGSGRALFGAMALGLPVLCPSDSIHAEYIEHGIDGWIYDDEATLAAAIDALLVDRSALRDAGEAARATALRLFEPRALADAYVRVVRRWRSAA